jgi:hypothetical protein
MAWKVDRPKWTTLTGSEKVLIAETICSSFFSVPGERRRGIQRGAKGRAKGLKMPCLCVPHSVRSPLPINLNEYDNSGPCLGMAWADTDNPV